VGKTTNTQNQKDIKQKLEIQLLLTCIHTLPSFLFPPLFLDKEKTKRGEREREREQNRVGFCLFLLLLHLAAKPTLHGFLLSFFTVSFSLLQNYLHLQKRWEPAAPYLLLQQNNQNMTSPY